MYEANFTKIIQESINNMSIKYCVGDTIWINNSTIPSKVHIHLAEGLSNHKITFKGAQKNGVTELMAV